MVEANARPRILAVDDHADALYALERMLTYHGFQVFSAAKGEEALQLAHKHKPSVVLLDVMMPQMDGLEVTRRLKADAELRFTPVLLLTAKDSLEDVIRGLEIGADGYITKPFKPEELLARIRAALRMFALYQELRSTKEKNSSLLRQISQHYSFENIVGNSPVMRELFALLEKIAPSSSPVLISGASGTGKELVARAIHYNSERRAEPFIAQNCAAFSEHLLESQLFGHLRGAFTGAIRDQKGLFEAADGGTLFLDEIGDMQPSLQAKLLRVLQDGKFMPVGSTDEKQVDVRILAASNRDLGKMCEQGSFREDLFYRLSVIRIHLPPLRERRSDISLLIEAFLRRAAEKRHTRQKTLSVEAMNALENYRWPGNIRELENEIERMLIIGAQDEILGIEHLSAHMRRSEGAEGTLGAGVGTEQEKSFSMKESVEGLERKMISEALAKTSGNKSLAAKELGISRSNLIAKVKQYRLEQ